MRKTYQTSQKKKIIEFMKTHPDRHFSAEEICQAVNAVRIAGAAGQDPEQKVGLSTVYRQLSQLCAEEILNKFSGSGGFVYQYVSGLNGCNHHFHLKCLGCGKIIHLECAMSEELIKHIGETHDFEIDSGKSVLYGTCDSCRARQGNNL